MREYGDVVFYRPGDGAVVVEKADPVIGIDLPFRAEIGTIDEDGHLLLAGDPNHRYRPVGFDTAPWRARCGAPTVLVCERVEA